MIFSNIRAPHLVLFGKAGLKGVRWEIFVDVSFAAPSVTGMDPDYFAEQFLDFRDAWLMGWQFETIEGDVGRAEAPVQRRRVVAFRHWDVLRF